MSLRTRLVAGLLGLAAVAMLVLAGVTYFEQRSFLRQRVDQQAKAAIPAVSHQLDVRGANVPGYDRPPPGRGDERAPPPGGRPDPTTVNLPPGTYGQRRDASGKVLGSVLISYGQKARPPPAWPKAVRALTFTTVDSVDGSDTRYRVWTEPTGDEPGTTSVAVALTDSTQTLHRLLLVEGLVIAGVLLALAGLSWTLVRVGLRPLERMGETAGAIAAGDLSRRVTP